MDAILGSVYKQNVSSDTPVIAKASFSNIYIDSTAGTYAINLANFIKNSELWPVLSVEGSAIMHEVRMTYYTSGWNVSTTQPTYVYIQLIRNSQSYLWYTYETNRTTSTVTANISFNGPMTDTSLQSWCRITLQPFSGTNSTSSYAKWYMHGTIETRYTPAFTI